jgi:glucokinase
MIAGMPHYNAASFLGKISRRVQLSMPNPKFDFPNDGLLLAGDIGATNTRLALFELSGPLRTPQRVANFIGADYSGWVEILHEYLADHSRPLVAACLGAAGPVVDGRIRLTNLPWIVDSAELAETFGLQGVWLLNDLQAIANSIPLLGSDDLHTLKSGKPHEHGNIAVIAPGTGLGIGYLTWAAGRYHAHATEGGHSDFAPANALQDEMLTFLRTQNPQVSVELVCSGIGLPNVYAFLKSTGRAEEPAWLAQQVAAVDDITPVIVENGLAAKPGSQLCQMALEIFVDVLAAAAGSLGLLFGATGGVFLGGGIPPRILPAFQRFKFMETFIAKTKYEYYLEHFPVHVILNAEAGILGAAAYGLQQLLDA